jgi:hypothetical protein
MVASICAAWPAPLGGRTSSRQRAMLAWCLAKKRSARHCCRLGETLRQVDNSRSMGNGKWSHGKWKAMSRKSVACIIAFLACAFPTLAAGQEEQQFLVCVGDNCRNTSGGANTITLDCSFARKFPTNTDQAVAEYVCTIFHDLTPSSVTRFSAVGGGGRAARSI